MAYLFPVLATALAYLLGSLSFAVIVSRAMGLSDPRTFGSKNPGATNVLRSGNKGAAVATLLLDAAKGWLPVVLVRWFGAPYGLEEGTQALVGLAAFVGHLWPVFFRFQGGKGVATALGVLLGFSGWLGLATAATWLIIAFFFRYSSLAALVAAVWPGMPSAASWPPWWSCRRCCCGATRTTSPGLSRAPNRAWARARKKTRAPPQPRQPPSQASASAAEAAAPA